MRSHITISLTVLSILIASLVVACSGQTQASPATPATAGGSAPAAAAAPNSSGGNAPIKVDLDKLFPPGPGRDLVLQNCTNCHSIAPIVLSEHDANGWQTHRLNHENRVAGLTPEEKDLVWAYLIKSFPPGRPLPELPPEMLKGEAGY